MICVSSISEWNIDFIKKSNFIYKKCIIFSNWLEFRYCISFSNSAAKDELESKSFWGDLMESTPGQKSPDELHTIYIRSHTLTLQKTAPRRLFLPFICFSIMKDVLQSKTFYSNFSAKSCISEYILKKREYWTKGNILGWFGLQYSLYFQYALISTIHLYMICHLIIIVLHCVKWIRPKKMRIKYNLY